MIKALETEIINEINLELPRKVLSKFETLIRESSSDDEKEAFQYLTELLDNVNVPYTLHQPKIYLSVPKKSRVLVSTPESIELRAKSPAFSVSTIHQGTCEGELVYITAGKNADEMDVWEVSDMDNQGSVKGKIVLSEGLAMPARVKYFEERGALG